MSFLNDYRPFFVYGTLRPQEVNYYLLDGHTVSEEPAHVQGLHLYSLGPYPMVIRAESDPQARVVGDLVTVKQDSYPQVLKHLDQLEEFEPNNPNSPYKRVIYPVYRTSGEIIHAWLYLGEKRFMQDWYRLIVNGDWGDYRRQNSIPPFQGLER